MPASSHPGGGARRDAPGAVEEDEMARTLDESSQAPAQHFRSPPRRDGAAVVAALALAGALALGAMAARAEPAPDTCPRDARVLDDYLFLHSLGVEGGALTAPWPRGAPRLEALPARPRCHGDGLDTSAPARAADCTPPRPARAG